METARLLTPATGIFVWDARRRVDRRRARVCVVPQSPHPENGCGVSLWQRWDSGWFLRIAEHGYSTDPVHSPAFFPLYPWLAGGLGRLIGDYALAGLVISLAACLLAFGSVRNFV